MPINLHTINQYFKKKLNPSDARDFIKKKSQNIKNIKNFEDKAHSMIGKDLYRDFLYGYTIKQWGTSPKNIPENVLKRLPVRFNYDDNYYNDHYQGIPKDGYTSIIKKILNHKSIRVILKKKYKLADSRNYDLTFYSGPIDKFFNYKFGMLNYRTVYWKKKIFKCQDFQGNPVINYNDPKIPYTRVIEHKHFDSNRISKKTVIYYEYSKKTTKKDIPFYPVRSETDKIKLDRYNKEAKKFKNLFFIGRLGTYRYLDMHIVIEESLSLFKKIKRHLN